LGNRCILYGMGRYPLIYLADLGCHQRKLAGTYIPYGRIPRFMGKMTAMDARFMMIFFRANPISPLNGRISSGLAVCRAALRRRVRR
jgi:hypothetical protein